MAQGLILSVFTGAGLLDRGFEQVGYSVVSAGDILYGRDVRLFTPISHAFEGVIGGPPCQDFSKARRSAPTGAGLAMLDEFARVVTQAAPEWFLCENVPGVPTIIIAGYKVQRFNLNARECGSRQNRLRTFQFGSRDGKPLVVLRESAPTMTAAPCCMATEGTKSNRRDWAEFCELQGLPRGFDLPGLSRALKYKLVGNGVPVPMARAVATAIKARAVTPWLRLCVCECGRVVKSNKTMATPACRKRMQRQRQRDAAPVTKPGPVTLDQSRAGVTEPVLSEPGTSR